MRRAASSGFNAVRLPSLGGLTLSKPQLHFPIAGLFARFEPCFEGKTGGRNSRLLGTYPMQSGMKGPLG